jgi:hypothetical protein
MPKKGDMPHMLRFLKKGFSVMQRYKTPQFLYV